jgi:flagellar basal-body rod protein FlgG
MMAFVTRTAGRLLAVMLVAAIFVGAQGLDHFVHWRPLATVCTGAPDQVVPTINARAPNSGDNPANSDLVDRDTKIMRAAENKVSPPSSRQTPGKDAAAARANGVDAPAAKSSAGQSPPRKQLLPVPPPAVPASRPVSSLAKSMQLPAAGGTSESVAVADGTSPELVIRKALAATAQARQLIVENLANASTPGYKRQIVSFATVQHGPSLSFKEQEPIIPPEAVYRLGAVMGPPDADMCHGKLRRTGRSLDLAIEGEGFFEVTPTDDPRGRGIYCTRCGRLALDRQGRIILRGLKRDWLLCPIATVPKGAYKIEFGTDGLIWVTEPQESADPKAGEDRTNIGTLSLCSFPPDCTFTPCGDNVFLPKFNKHDGPYVGMPEHWGRGKLRQGCLEESNVDPQQELEDLQKLQQHALILEQAAHLLHLGDGPHHGLPDRPAR